MLIMFDPAGHMEAFFAELVGLGMNAGAGQQSERGLFSRYGIEFVGPPLKID
jgi:hypothetical protein